MAKILNYNEHYFDIIDTPNKAYFLGLLRKYIKGIPIAIQVARDNGCLNHPLRIRVA